MSPIALCIGSTVIYWSAFVITLGLLAALLMTLYLQQASGGRRATALLFMILTLVLSVPLCRAIHWYCHIEQYDSLREALTNYSSGSYVLSGAMLGAWLAALIASRFDRRSSTASLLDAFAPGAALAVAFIRLSALFNSSCRSKIVFHSPALRHLPLASGVINTAGQVEYRFATFFVQFLLMLVICWLLLRFFSRRRAVPMKSGAAAGNTARMFLLYYGACELLMDSTRYDSSFMHFNGFVSMVQIIAAVSILALLVYYSVHSVRAAGGRPTGRHWRFWGGWFLALVIVGMSEYLVQRFGDWYLPCYSAMAVGCLLMVFVVYRVYQSCCAEDDRP
ncbi:MAG: prolipoprotein diacylglyceryl transferase [Oscillospiraceae bacterium]|nr:prolipoprotein diacylglyceryl transferase [Oscillospiraceae bacterium]